MTARTEHHSAFAAFLDELDEAAAPKDALAGEGRTGMHKEGTVS
jgi:hypothetical protein